MEKEKYKYIGYYINGDKYDFIFRCDGQEVYCYKNGEWVKKNKTICELIENDNCIFISEEEAKKYIKERGEK